jgi:hypothetical protein
MLKAKNRILRDNLPDRITATAGERASPIKVGTSRPPDKTRRRLSP